MTAREELSAESAERSAVEEIDAITAAFFRHFDNRVDTPDLTRIASLFLPEAMIFKQAGSTTEAMTLDAFITPRQTLFQSGTLQQFHEWETTHKTIPGHGVACRLSQYEKAGLLNGQPYAGKGSKTFQFLHTDTGWKIAGITWCDLPSPDPINERDTK